MARKSKPKNVLINLSHAVAETARSAFTDSNTPVKAARDWLLEEFCCGWQVPIVGFGKVRKEYWQKRKSEAKESLEFGLFVPPRELDFGDPREWLALADEILWLDPKELEMRLSVLRGGEMPSVALPIFKDEEVTTSFYWAGEIESQWTSDVPLAEIRRRFPEASEEAKQQAFSDPRIAAKNLHARYANALTVEATRWVEANPPEFPTGRPYPSSKNHPNGVSLTLSEAITWIAIGEPFEWGDWIHSLAQLTARESVRRDRLFTLAKSKLLNAVAEQDLKGMYAEGGVLPWAPFTPAMPRRPPSVDLFENQIVALVHDGSHRVESVCCDGVYFLAADLAKCWPNAVSTQTVDAPTAQKSGKSGGAKRRDNRGRKKSPNTIDAEKVMKDIIKHRNGNGNDTLSEFTVKNFMDAVGKRKPFAGGRRKLPSRTTFQNIRLRLIEEAAK